MTAAPFDTAVVAAVPSILIDGEVDDSLTAGLLSLMVTETEEGLTNCEVNIGNWGSEGGGSTGFRYFDRRVLDFGKPFAVRFGPPGGEGVIFEGRISALEAQFALDGQRYITVLAEDRLQDLRMTRRSRVFENLSDADMMRQIASEHGLTAAIQVTGPQHRVLAQVNQSDLAFLRERARTTDAELWIEGSILHAATRSQRTGATIPFSYPGTLREFSVLADLAHQRSELIVSGWDVGAKQAITARAGESLLQGELDGGTSGASILRAAFGERKETVAHAVPQSTAEAQAEADTLFRRMARQFITGRGLADPDPRLRVGVTVDLTGLGPLFSGRYYVSMVRHLFDRGHGLRSEMRVERPGLGQPR